MSAQPKEYGIEDMGVKRHLLKIIADRLLADNASESVRACDLLRAIDGDLLRAERLERERGTWIRSAASLRSDKISSIAKSKELT